MEALSGITGRFVVPAAAIAIIVVIAVASSRTPSGAQSDPIVSVDAISDASNTATTVGPIDTCISTTAGATFDADVVIQGVTNIAGFQANLLYNPSVLKVTSVNYNFLLATTGASVLDLGNSAPDTDGDFLLAAAMFSFISVTGANGDGVLAQVSFQAVGSGSSALDLTSVKLSDANGIPIPPTDASNFYAGPVNDGSVAVDSSCTSTPTPTPVAVGGLAAFPGVAEHAAATADPSGGSSFPYAALAGGLVGVLALAAGGWYAGRRWLR